MLHDTKLTGKTVKGLTFKDVYDFLHAYLLLTGYTSLLLNYFYLGTANLTVQIDSLGSVKRTVQI